MPLTCVVVLFFSLNSFAQQPPAKHYTNKEFRELDDHYGDFQKEIRDIQKQREILETALKAYNIKLKTLAQSMEKTEEQIDFASGTFSYDPDFIASTREVQAIAMAYDLKSVDLISHVHSEHDQLTRVGEVMALKYDKMKKIKSAGR
jgi:cell division septum initiation protein DivIVA